MAKKKNIIDIEKEVIEKYHVTIDTHSKCRWRMHAHVKERRICKWEFKNSLVALFDLLHEIGHIMTTKTSMRRAESEYYATCFAIDVFKEYSLTVPDRVMHVYQRYILQEIARGKRRKGKGYSEMNIYKYAGINKSIEEFCSELDKAWAACIVPWVIGDKK